MWVRVINRIYWVNLIFEGCIGRYEGVDLLVVTCCCGVEVICLVLGDVGDLGFDRCKDYFSVGEDLLDVDGIPLQLQYSVGVDIEVAVK